jgi:hypothetical protein
VRRERQCRFPPADESRLNQLFRQSAGVWQG